MKISHFLSARWTAVWLGLGLTFLPVGNGHAADPTPQLTPGNQFSIEFPDMPRTFLDLVNHNGVKPTMTVFLPHNYDASRQFPILIFLGGEAGGHGTNPAVARKLSQEQDFICVDLPLFKAIDPSAAIGAPAQSPKVDLKMGDADYKLTWSLYKTMLAKLAQVVPNVDPVHGIIGGFSNGGHTVAGLIDQSDGEVTQRFSAFFLVEGGGRLKRYDLLNGKPVLLVYGEKSSREQRMQQFVSALQAAGAKPTLQKMSNIGHAFPESEYPGVRAWLTGPARQ